MEHRTFDMKYEMWDTHNTEYGTYSIEYEIYIKREMTRRTEQSQTFKIFKKKIVSR